ncbi:TPA: YqcI/YcgG family protein [Salmonella enterica subsp. diarizonae serovar 16:z10:e,n,x,z15]|nr:YqcI/YcgG family protein [Salmonella enterica subsp. diarizonae serovar 16:z10:e,n,x,z15]
MKKYNSLSRTIVTKKEFDYLIKIKDISLLMINSYAEITDKLSDSNSPCLFGRHVWKMETVLFSFISRKRINEDLISSLSRLKEYTKIKKEKEQSFVWEQIQYLHDRDIGEWPDSIPEEPECSEWTFFINKIESFINVNYPGHKEIRSRNLGNNIIFVINPRKYFDVVDNIIIPKGVKTREKICSRVRVYNDDESLLELGFYEDDNNREWR